MGMRPHTKRPCEKRWNEGETEGREHNREVQESKTEVVWPRNEARPRTRRKKDSGDGTTWEKNNNVLFIVRVTPSVCCVTALLGTMFVAKNPRLLAASILSSALSSTGTK